MRNNIDPDITWFLSLTVDDMKRVRAVIEAAKAWHRWQWKDPQRSAYEPETWDERLASTIEALQEVE